MTNWDIVVLILCFIWIILAGIWLTILSIKIHQEEKELRHIRKLRYELEKKVEEFNKNEITETFLDIFKAQEMIRGIR